VQSFDDRKLARLGRIHGADEARRAYAMARSAGVDNINLDLMYGLPGQTVDEAGADLEAALDLGPEHLSHYQLTLEPQTVFARTPPSDLPDDDALVEMLEACQPLLVAAGFEQYEVSAYARPGRRSRHNLNYWLFGDYLAVGAGGHAKYTLADGQIRRRARQRTPSLFLKTAGTAAGLAEDRRVDAGEIGFEFMLNALRLRDGFAISEFGERTGLALERQPGFGLALSRGLLERHADRIRASDLGYRFLNDTVACFLNERAPADEIPR
jgi:oxygen-independent coproporphyrinogen-3 oxidase